MTFPPCLNWTFPGETKIQLFIIVTKTHRGPEISLKDMNKRSELCDDSIALEVSMPVASRQKAKCSSSPTSSISSNTDIWCPLLNCFSVETSCSVLHRTLPILCQPFSCICNALSATSVPSQVLHHHSSSRQLHLCLKLFTTAAISLISLLSTFSPPTVFHCSSQRDSVKI